MIMGSSSSSPPEKQSNSSTRVEIRNLKEQINKKADDTLTKKMFEIHEEDIREVKKIALSTKTAFGSRVCQKEKVIEKMEKTIVGWRNFRFFSGIGLMVIIAGGLLQFFMLKDTAEDTADAQKAMDVSVMEIKKATNKNTVMFKEHIESDKEKELDRQKENQELLEDIRDAVKKEIKRGRK